MRNVRLGLKVAQLHFSTTSVVVVVVAVGVLFLPLTRLVHVKCAQTVQVGVLIVTTAAAQQMLLLLLLIA